MKNKKRMNFDGSQLLPEETIFFEIFARLPVKSLLRFKCVSKPCRALTSDPNFIHARNSRAPTRYLLSFTSSLLNGQSVFYSLNPRTSEKPEFVEYFRNRRYDSYSKSINGLLCLLKGVNSIVVSNPGMNKNFAIPNFLTQSQLDRDFVHFSYDPKTDNYKVLRATSTRIFNAANQNLGVTKTNYSIFTLGVDKSWREFEGEGIFQLGQSKSICVDGVFYCTNFSTTTKVEDGIIAAFDVGSESFGIVKYPGELSDRRYGLFSLIEVKGRVGVVDVKDFKSCAISLWIRVENCWVVYRIEFPLQWESIFSLTLNFSFSGNRDGEIVFASCGMSTGRCSIFVYNMEMNRWRRMEVLGLERDVIFGDFLIEEYVEAPMLLD